MLGATLSTLPPTVVIWDTLYDLYNILGAIAAVLVISYLLYNILRNRRKDNSTRVQEHQEEERVNWRKILFTLAITSTVLFAVELQTFNSEGLIVPPQSADALHIGVVGRQWSWTFVYPNGFKVVGNLTVPAGKMVILNITSLDVAHSFAITGLDVAKDAIPGRYNTLWFTTPTHNSIYTIRCKELCGVGHAFMTAKMTVIQQLAYDVWYQTLGVK